MGSHERDRRRDRVRRLELDVTPLERPRRKVDVRVGERGKHATPPEIDAIGRRQRPLVCSDAPGHERACDRQSAGRRQRAIERANDAVVEDHARSVLTRRARDREQPWTGSTTPSPTRAASSLVGSLRTGEIGALELLELYLDRIERLDGPIRSVVTLAAERARGEASAADAARARGDALGPLHGLPITIKDSIETSGIRTTSGSRTYSGHVPAEDAPVVARLRAAGAIVYGKTNLSELANDIQSYNELFGTTSNPWNHGRTAGGSSGGAAAAVAAGLTALDIGSDIGGSIRQPAANCGVFGLKPSYGIVPSRGHIPGPPGTLAEADIAAVGPIARSADDLALVLGAIAGPDVDRAAAWRVELPAPQVGSIGVWLEDADFPLDAGVRTCLIEAAEHVGAVEVRPSLRLGEAMRLYVELLAPLLTLGEPAETVDRWRAAEAAGERPWAGESRAWEIYGVGLTRDWLAANEQRLRLLARWREETAGLSAVLCPVTTVTAIPHDHAPHDDRRVTIDAVSHPYRVQSPWLWAVGLLYVPAVSAPVGFSDGLPVGAQVVAPYGHDRTAIEVARRIGSYVVPP